jgi:cytochrome c biogenesis protein CcmG, thiol:disulfide interchange protein DsbE
MNDSDPRRARSVRLATAALLLLTAASAQTPTSLAQSRLPLSLQDPNTGRTVRIEPGAKALHLVFLATWCRPCVEEFRRLGDLEARWAGRGYRLVLVAVATRQTAERLTRFASERQPPGILLFDVDGGVQAALSADGLPTHVLLDASGMEVARSGHLAPALEKAVEGLLSGGRPEAP